MDLFVEVEVLAEGDFKITILREDKGAIADYDSKAIPSEYISITTIILEIYLTVDGKVNAIRHPYHLFTSANKEKVKHVSSILDETFDMTDLKQNLRML